MGAFGMLLGNRHLLRFAVGGSRGGKDDFLHIVAQHRVQQLDATGNVGAIKNARLADRFFDQRFRGEVHDGVNALGFEGAIERGGIEQVALEKLGFRRQRGAMAFHQAIHHHQLVSLPGKHLRANAADVSRAARK